MIIYNLSFDITVEGEDQTVTLDGEVTIDGNSLSGSGDLLLLLPGFDEPFDGTFSVTGLK